MMLPYCAAAFCIVATTLNLGGLVMAAIRLRPRSGYGPMPADAPAVTIIRPLCGLNDFERETLASTFSLDYPRYDILFCLEDAGDPVAGLVYNLIEKHPHIPARLLIGEDRRTQNPKLNNCLKGWDAATAPWIIIADSNALMPKDSVQRMMGRWTARTGLVCSMPIGSRPANFWAELECAFLNTFQARWQYVAESLGMGFAQGKCMLMRRDIVEAGGGLLEALGGEIAEDAAFTKLVRRAGLHVHLVDVPFRQPLGRRREREVWGRQARWAMLRRKTFPILYLPELLTGSLFPIAAGLYAAWNADVNVAAVAMLLLGLWFGSEALLARLAGWHFSSRMLLACALRDVLLPLLWLVAWIRQDYVWRGTAVTMKQSMVEELEESRS